GLATVTPPAPFPVPPTPADGSAARSRSSASALIAYRTLRPCRTEPHQPTLAQDAEVVREQVRRDGGDRLQLAGLAGSAVGERRQQLPAHRLGRHGEESSRFPAGGVDQGSRGHKADHRQCRAGRIRAESPYLAPGRSRDFRPFTTVAAGRYGWKVT